MAPSSSSKKSETSIPLTSEAEMDVALVRLRARRTAPGLFDKCLSTGQFPKPWKMGRLCLLRKGSRPPNCPSAYRPIVLMNETAKMLEKILAARLGQHLGETGPGLAKVQFRLIAGCSNLKALNSLRALSAEAVSSEDVH
ncbi:unnamed protein product [Euphydryas editha]|uniref:Reverse transcriptase n=1 Tax=Euphydryas editha TaxID=104508 RepID=A0AAU9TKX6_EUPED|nr:unnamed protein product [Euphydryas editha]